MPRAELDHAQLAFGTVLVGASDRRTLTVTANRRVNVLAELDGADDAYFRLEEPTRASSSRRERPRPSTSSTSRRRRARTASR